MAAPLAAGYRATSPLSPGSTLRHQIPTLSRHYPDTSTLRHQCQPTLRHLNRHSVRHSDTSVRPVSSHLASGPPRLVSSSVKGVKTKPTLRHSTPPTPPTPRHLTSKKRSSKTVLLACYSHECLVLVLVVCVCPSLASRPVVSECRGVGGVGGVECRSVGFVLTPT